jgi:hypothetical protein
MEEMMNRGDKGFVARLNVTEDELVARVSSCLKMAGFRNSESSKEGRGRGGGDTSGRASGSGSGNIVSDECHYCKKKGHWSKECRRKKWDKQAHMMQADEEVETSLLITCVNVNVKPMPSALVEVHLNETKLFIQLSDKQGGEYMHWILDSDATNHMRGEHEAFSEIETKVHGTVCFRDGFVANIDGCGMILLQCKNASRSLLYSMAHREYSKSQAARRGRTSDPTVQWLPQGLGSTRDPCGEGGMHYKLALHTEAQRWSARVSGDTRE